MSINLALNKTASASSFIKPFLPSRAVDGNNKPEFRWICNSLPGWLSVDLGSECWIDRWVVTHMGAGGWDDRYNLCDYSFQGSLDNTTWATLDTVSNNTVNSTDRKIATVKVRYVKVNVTKGIAINPKLASIIELQVYEAESSTSALSSLATTPGTLEPQFNRAILNYVANVGYDVTNITVTPMTEDDKATVKVNGVLVKRGQVSLPIALNVGDNNIDIEVTPYFGPAKTTYKINAVRASSPYLANLQIGFTTLSPAFNKTVLNYTATMSNAVASIKSTVEDTGAPLTLNGEAVQSGITKQVSLNPGENTVVIKVVSKTGVDYREYKVIITRRI
jgi:hypothetical protein